ncbi:hypothetical protein GOBAR_AA32097 [Gossypium barbadense]|uniref:Uncharacterized protein n=1 Tax=Gossypium barbadense TaxID=3634 RepID=A0A2P5WBW4_GOSBA|nr:hypothetical protein GOBAR_AA32097 [Gossypium barbadense]
MTTGRINQVAFVRDFGTAWLSTCCVSNEEVIAEHEHRSCQETKCIGIERQGPKPYSQKYFQRSKARTSTNAPTRPHRFKGTHSGHRARLWSTWRRDGTWYWGHEQLRMQARPWQGQGADGSQTWEAQGVPNMTGENGQAKLEPIATHKPPQEIFARYREPARTSEVPGCPCCSRHPHIQRPRLPMVFEAPTHPITKVSMLLEPPAHLRQQGADGARGSCTTKDLGYRWCPRLPHDQGPRLPMVSEAPVHPSTKGLGCRWCPRLPHISSAKGAHGVPSGSGHTTEGPKVAVGGSRTAPPPTPRAQAALDGCPQGCALPRTPKGPGRARDGGARGPLPVTTRRP